MKAAMTTSSTMGCSRKPCVVASLQKNQNPAPSAPSVRKSNDNRWAAGLIGAAAAITLALSPPALAKESFLRSTGGRGILVEEEEKILKLREDLELEAREELERAREELEVEAREQVSNGQLCATPFGIDVVGITEFIALTGALVGGVSARRRKQELERLNEQLRTINTQLRQQARAGTLYAPGLTYAPMGNSNGNGSIPDMDPASSFSSSSVVVATIPLPPPPVPEVIPDPAPPAANEVPSISLISIDEEDTPEAKQCQQALKEGKKLLKEKAAGPSMVRFEKALMLAKHLGDKVRERRAVRGLAAASRLGGQSRVSIKYLERVLEISKEMGEYTGDADAYGTIADVYTDMGEFEKAAEFYDKYISAMGKDGPV